MLPNFLVIGTAKAGSTSLYSYLHQHPQIYMSPVKEPGFFLVREHPVERELNENANPNAYAFPDRGSYEALFTPNAGEKAIGEASVAYLCYPVVVKNLLELVPDVKMIAILRDPSERAFSHFQFDRYRNFQPNPDFDDLIRQEIPQLDQPLEWGVSDPSYLRTGLYSQHLQRFFQAFDRAQFDIHLHEELLTQPENMLKTMFTFLNVDPKFDVDTSSHYMQTGQPRSRQWDRFLTHANPVGKALRPFLSRRRRRAVAAWLNAPNLRRPALPPATRARLADIFRPDILTLQDLLHKDLSAWLVL